MGYTDIMFTTLGYRKFEKLFYCWGNFFFWSLLASTHFIACIDVFQTVSCSIASPIGIGPAASRVFYCHDTQEKPIESDNENSDCCAEYPDATSGSCKHTKIAIPKAFVNVNLALMYLYLSISYFGKTNGCVSESCTKGVHSVVTFSRTYEMAPSTLSENDTYHSGHDLMKNQCHFVC